MTTRRGFLHSAASSRHACRAAVDGGGQAIERCDAGKNQYGPIAFHTWDETAEECSCGADTPADPLTGNHYILFHELTYVSSVFGSAAIGGQVIYLESSDADAEVLTVANRHSASARTIQELLRLMMEWEVAGTDFGSTEAMVGVATEMLEGLNMPVTCETGFGRTFLPTRYRSIWKVGRCSGS